MKRALPILCTAFLLTAALVSAQPGHRFHGAMAGGPGMGGDHTAMLTKVLGLNDSQQAAVKELNQKLSDTVKPLFDQMRAKHQAIQSGLDKNASAAALGQLLIDSHKIQLQIKAAHESFDKEVVGLLTADQATKFSALQEMRQSFHPEPPPAVQ